ncbi:alpha-L-rhamnosidase-related protein [Draconibacterium sediminis]|uniref:Alpha-L-rhamnosidase six-hairpin glycosidase domain-containing protein n=1 Tax=Draconibacterium sediminis TaxID=1544798 RepID=A0A0D8J990_9BACT|nr:hypothetical protein [Draconibacterium sediminis]KJF43570.1 hypothetical protein LH29_10620 [Draconibacterium sediminis]
MKKIEIMLILLLVGVTMLQAQHSRNWWNMTTDGGIVWNVKSGVAHIDHIEMSGTQVSTIVHYGINNDGSLFLEKETIFPMLRFHPNKTKSHLSHKFDQGIYPPLLVDGTELQEYPKSFYIKGFVKIQSRTNTPLVIERTIFPSVDKAAVFELINLRNTSSSACKVQIPSVDFEEKTDPEKGIYGEYTVRAQSDKNGEYTINPGEELDFNMAYSAHRSVIDPYAFSPAFEFKKREKLIGELGENLILDTPNDTIDCEFAFAKIRAAESIYDTKGGLMHGPGGGSYYAAIWANDQAEYINPFFPFLGNLKGNESAINSYRHFARFINSAYKPIPSSIISEGVGTWHGAKDRGDQAMIAYGASRFALAYGDKKTAEELWPLITWCLEYLERKKSDKGVVFSDSDELENRFENGDFNLATNSLTYGGLIAASSLAMELHKHQEAEFYQKRAAELRTAIENYFGANVQGFNTYQYYEGNTTLRSWICYPLNMGIYDRKDETAKALFSNALWTKDGLLTESGTTTFWDRSTLHAFKGLLAAGEVNPALDYFAYYSAVRLLGDHVPYPVEAWPEGNQRHLSAESGLYCRIVTEGLFGIEPIGFRTFRLTPHLPDGWDFMRLRKIRAFQADFDIDVKREGKRLRIRVKENGRLLRDIDWPPNRELIISLN